MLVAAHQPNFLPWVGYFAKAFACDAFVLMDDARIPQGRSYASRTKIRNGDDGRWLSLPIVKKSGQTYREARIADASAYDQHLRTLAHAYTKAPAAAEAMDFLRPLYEARPDFLIDFNLAFINGALDRLGHDKPRPLASEWASGLAGSQWLADLTVRAGGDAYLSGPGGASYIDDADFAARNVSLRYGSYEPKPYAAPGFAFQPGLSLVDALFVVGFDGVRGLLDYSFKD